MAPTTSKWNPARRRTWADSGVNYIKGAKVGSTRGFIATPAGLMALPFRQTRAQSAPCRFSSRTEYSESYREQPYCYASMDRKPLTSYDPNAHRSRLAVDDPPVPYSNASAISFRAGTVHNDKRRFVTTSQSFFQGEPLDPRSNPAMTAETSRLRRHMREQ
eukprot:TRINITY_DN31839_c0_g1_i5.p1 TRINITY_DN31839_c0_g1~~TRINITY_DN31839_c0_g1_i5.p1  ORF type:complete len:161 (-),score=6.62 TRINITY_DN31839_c0_g1_i5:69-551(-)